MRFTASIFDHHGHPIELGERLGAGGEGSVFAVPERGSEVVAKLYHESLPPQKRAKLTSMVACSNEPLRRISAWPQALLHAGRHGPVCGFLMPRLFEHEAIHNVYGPAHRKAKYPQADWAFLVQVARNVAAAFDTIHAHGHVIGDVNQGNVFVAANALVRLIDCDSFQIAAPDTLYRCEVGVPHFTAPELLGMSSFRELERSAQHDNFGLAVLIFHLLFMGRHPFAGVYAGHEDMPIERAIQEFRYAFGHTAEACGMSRPPGSVGPEIATAEIAGLFEYAFCPPSKHLQRPAARRWVQALDALKGEIRTCGEHTIHRYCGALAGCPWCLLERSERLVFFIGMLDQPIPMLRGFSLQAAWQQIDAAAKVVHPPLPVMPTAAVVGRSLPVTARISRIAKWALRCIAIVVPLLLIVRVPVLTLVWSLVGFWGWELAGRWRSRFEYECERRRVTLAVAEQRWQAVQRRWLQLSGEEEAQRKLLGLQPIAQEYRSLRTQHEVARRQLQAQLRQQHLARFLARFRLSTANIPSISASHRLTLAAVGIETAADIELRRLTAVRGLSRDAIDQLWHWRRELERWSQLEKVRIRESADMKALARQFMQRRQQLATILSQAPADFRQLAANFAQQRHAFMGVAQQAAEALAHARADMTALQ